MTQLRYLEFYIFLTGHAEGLTILNFRSSVICLLFDFCDLLISINFAVPTYQEQWTRSKLPASPKSPYVLNFLHCPCCRESILSLLYLGEVHNS